MPVSGVRPWARLVSIESDANEALGRWEEPLGFPIGTLRMVGDVHEGERPEIGVVDLGRPELKFQRFEYVNHRAQLIWTPSPA